MTKTKLPTRTVKGYGWRPDLPDARDYSFDHATAKRLPKSVDLRLSPYMPAKIWDQGNYGSCTAHAVGAALAFAHNKHEALARILAGGYMPSRFFIYRGERVIEGDPAQDNGAQIRDGFKVIATLGTPPESMYAYNAKHFNLAPTKAVLAAAAKVKATQYKRVQSGTVNGIRTAIAAGFPVAIGFTVYSEMESDEVARTGVLPMPAPGSQVLGGHAVLAVHYDDTAKTITLRNSWSSAWGQKGYFTMPYAYIEDSNLADDFWVCEGAS